jgi:hypothetical protein
MKKLDQMYLRDLRLKGVPGIKKVFLRQAKSTQGMTLEQARAAATDADLPFDEEAFDGYQEMEEWLLDTEGINLREVRGLGACAGVLGPGGMCWGAGAWGHVLGCWGQCWGQCWR